MRCDRIGCPNDAYASPIVSFSSKAKPDARAEMKIPLFVCKEHATDDVSQFVGDQGWQQIVAAVKKAGRAAPDRGSLRVRYVPIC